MEIIVTQLLYVGTKRMEGKGWILKEICELDIGDNEHNIIDGDGEHEMCWWAACDMWMVDGLEGWPEVFARSGTKKGLEFYL